MWGKVTFSRAGAVGLASVLAFAASSASATIYQYDLTGAGTTYSWYLDSNPATAYAGNVPPAQTFNPDQNVPSSGFLVTDVQGFPGSFPGFTHNYVADITFYNTVNLGGLTLTDHYLAGSGVDGGTDILSLNSAAALYMGPDTNPVMTLGTFALSDANAPTAPTPYLLTVRICPLCSTSAVPEPSAWMLMLTGFGLMGAFLRRRPALVKYGPATA